MNVLRVHPPSIRRSDWVWICLVLSVALIFRVIKLDSGLWYDEIGTLVEFVRLPTMQLLTTLTFMNNHLLYSLEAKAAIAMFGESAWALRLPAVIFGVASVGALWWFARRLVTASEANVAGLLMAVSYHHIWFSQNARGYTGLMFWALVGTGLFIQAVEQSSWRAWLTYACVLAVAAFTHLSALFFFGIHGLLYLALTGMRLRSGARMRDFKPIAGFGLGVFLIALLHAPVLPQIVHHVTSKSTQAVSREAEPEWNNPLWTALEVLRNLKELGPITSVGLPAVLGLAAIGVLDLLRRHPLVVAVFLIHIPVTLVFLVLLSFHIWPRYFFIDLGFIFLCVAHGVFVGSAYLARSVGSRKSSNDKTLALIASGVAVLCSLLVLGPNYRYPKQDFLGARNFVERARAPQDAVATIGLASYAFSKYYAPEWQAVDSWQEIRRLRLASTRIWLVYTSELQLAANNPQALEHIKSEFELMARFPGTLGDGAVFVYRSRAADQNHAF